MNKTELINSMSEKSGLSKKASKESLEAFMAVVGDALVDREKIQLVGFGTFEVRQRAAKKGKNPQTQEPLDIPAYLAPTFKAGKALKDIVNGRS